jgi:hypothetical protein
MDVMGLLGIVVNSAMVSTTDKEFCWRHDRLCCTSLMLIRHESRVSLPLCKSHIHVPRHIVQIDATQTFTKAASYSIYTLIDTNHQFPLMSLQSKIY